MSANNANPILRRLGIKGEVSGGHFNKQRYDDSHQNNPNDEFNNFDGDKFIIAALYVDDVLFTGNWNSEIKRFKTRLSELYELNDINPISWFLGWHITRDIEEGWLK